MRRWPKACPRLRLGVVKTGTREHGMPVAEGITPRIVLVTDPAYGDAGIVRCVKAAASALPPGWLAVQLRDKRRARVSLRVFAEELRVVTRAVGAALVVNGDAEVARDVGADGVHLGASAGPVESARSTMGRPAWVSVAAHSDEDVERAAAEGADAVLVSPMFDSRDKRGRGVGALERARRIAGSGAGSAGTSRRRMTVVALGGIDAKNAAACIRAGADAVAVMRALLGVGVAGDPYRTAQALHDALARRC